MHTKLSSLVLASLDDIRSPLDLMALGASVQLRHTESSRSSPVLDADNILFQAQENENQGGKARESKWDDLLTGRGIGGVGSFPWSLSRCGRRERKTAMRFLGRKCGRAPHPCSHHCEFMGYVWPGDGRAMRATSVINNGSHLAILVHQGSDPTPPYQALVIRQSATLQAKASRATRPQGVVRLLGPYGHVRSFSPFTLKSTGFTPSLAKTTGRISPSRRGPHCCRLLLGCSSS